MTNNKAYIIIEDGTILEGQRAQVLESWFSTLQWSVIQKF